MTARHEWWNTRWFACAAILLSTVPLLWPANPPLVDMGEHIGRYHVALNLAQSADLQRHWTYHWALIGNLGADLAVMPLGHLLGAELAAKIVVLLIPPLFVAGLIAVSRAATDRLSPAAAFAFPLAYSYPMQMGFVNFMFAASLALLALAGWIALGNARKLWLRAALFVPVAFVLWVAHSFGWGMFGLLAFATELVRRRRAGERWAGAFFGSALACTPLAWPVIFMLTGGGSGDGGAGISWEWPAKIVWLASLLRERWVWFDAAGMLVLYAMLWIAAWRRQLSFDPMLGAAALVCLAAFLILPRLLLGGAYVDMRMLPFAVAFALIAIRAAPDTVWPRAVAIAATAFFAVRTVATTIAFGLFAQSEMHALEVVQHIPRGAAVLFLENEPCAASWPSARLGHIAGIALARRDIFENAQWSLPGQQLIGDRHPATAPFRNDPSQLIYPAGCPGFPNTRSRALARFDRKTFAYVWTVGFSPRPRLAPDLRLEWSNGLSTLYRVEATK